MFAHIKMVVCYNFSINVRSTCVFYISSYSFIKNKYQISYFYSFCLKSKDNHFLQKCLTDWYDYLYCILEATTKVNNLVNFAVTLLFSFVLIIYENSCHCTKFLGWVERKFRINRRIFCWLIKYLSKDIFLWKWGSTM